MPKSTACFGTALFALLVAVAAQHAAPPLRAQPLVHPLSVVPLRLGQWHGEPGAPSHAVPVDTRADQYLLRTYRQGTQEVWVSVAYYGLQTEGRRHPALSLLYPSRGWVSLRSIDVSISLDGPDRGDISPGAILLEQPDRRVLTLYWYQVQSYTLATEYANRMVLFVNSILRRRTDGVLVRVAAPVSNADLVAPVLEAQTDFIKVFVPALLPALPR